MKKGRIVVLIGRSGCGKDFFMKKLIGELIIKPVVTYTSRPKRDGELNGKDYYFVTKEEFDKMVKDNDFIEHISYNTIHGEWSYGTHQNSFQNDEVDHIVILDYKGYLKVRKMYPKRVIGFMIHLDKEVRKVNYIERGGSIEEFERREHDDNVKFNKASEDYSLYHINNDYGKTNDRIKLIKELTYSEES
ncbi:MAG: hypothetical protein ACRCX8_14425 [Sarcina sp.]